MQGNNATHLFRLEINKRKTQQAFLNILRKKLVYGFLMYDLANFVSTIIS